MDTGIRSLRKVFRNGSCSDWPLAMTFSLFFKQADGGEHTTGPFAEPPPQKRQEVTDRVARTTTKLCASWGSNTSMAGIDRNQVSCRLASWRVAAWARATAVSSG